MKFEWDEEKNRRNIQKHGVSLEIAAAIFNDPQLYEWHDIAHSGYNKYGIWEDRYIALGWVERVLFVVYSVRGGNEEVIRMISARKARKSEMELYEDWCSGLL